MKPTAIALLLLLLAACVRTRTVEPEATPEVLLDSATVAFFSMLRERATSSTTLPNREIILCLYGTVEGRTISVMLFRSPRILSASDTTISYIPCSGTGYLGTWHTHPEGSWGDGCWHSATDREVFYRRKEDVLALVTCAGGRIVALVKKGYSKQ